MQLVIDSNVYIFAFGLAKVPASQELILTIGKKPSLYTLRISRSIVEEIRQHLFPEDFRKFITTISVLAKNDEDILVSFELGAKYEAKGLKSADALIAAYTEWTGANVLVTENRHFLSRQTDLPFKVLTAHNCLKFIKSSL